MFGESGPRFERVEIWAGSSVSAKSLRQHATIRIDESAEPSTLYAQIDGCAMGTGCRVVRVSAFAIGDRLPSDMILWPVPEPATDDDGDGETDPKNLPSAYAGLLRQAYNHNEHLMGIMQSQTTALLMHLQAENKALREERVEMREALVRSESVATERETKAFEMQAKLMRDRALIGGAETLVKAAATHIALPAGAASLGQEPPIMDAMRELIAGLEGDQLSRMAEIFKQEQFILLTTIMEKINGKAQ